MWNKGLQDPDGFGGHLPLFNGSLSGDGCRPFTPQQWAASLCWPPLTLQCVLWLMLLLLSDSHRCFFFFPWLFLNSLELLTLKPSPYINLTAWPLCSHVNASYCRVENISVTQTQAMQMTTQSHLCSVSVSARCCSACLPLFARNKGGRREVDYKGPSRGREERGGVTGGLMLFGWHVRYVFSSLVDGRQSQSPPEQRVFSSVKLSRRRL